MRHFKVNDILTAADREPFHALLDDPKQTLDTLHAWMIGRGYKVCRGAVFHYRRAVRENVLAHLNGTMAGCSDGSARKRITASLAKIHGRDLAILAGMVELMRLSAGNGMGNRQRPKAASLSATDGSSARSPGGGRLPPEFEGLSMGV